MPRLASLVLAAALTLPGVAAAEPPGRRPVVTTTSSMVILEPIRFHGATAALDARSTPMLDTVASMLVAHADLELIEVRAYGPEAPTGARQQLGRARAKRIVAALIRRGIAPARLRAVGTPAAAAGPEFVIVRRRSDPR